MNILILIQLLSAEYPMISDDSFRLRLKPPEVNPINPNRKHKPLKPSNECLIAHVRLNTKVSTIIDIMKGCVLEVGGTFLTQSYNQISIDTFIIQ